MFKHAHDTQRVEFTRASVCHAKVFKLTSSCIFHIFFVIMIPTILEHVCPFFVHIAQMGLIFPRWGLILPRILPPNPVLYSVVTHPFRVQNTPKPTPKHSFSWPELESGQNELNEQNVWAIWTPTGQNV